uniref:snRNA-activating protein complex subunit 4 n=2 Tax=Monopterus albus TaxID=43700 RepID=A0A3Q3IMV5_MONAL|nr:snRNA-activating protein complex subunit 4 isoform X2 [Monopterus albus]XP_020450673.1 snRNA-activating protein complex subunit 4 isoform X2 [Monopterus albus]
MSLSLSAKRDRIQQQVEELEQSLSVTHTELELLSSETDDDDDTEEEAGQAAAGLLAQRDKIQKEIQNLETVLGPHSPVCVSDGDDSSGEESELELSVDSCIQLNLVYQQVVQETLDQLETLLTQNQRQQKELVSQLSGSIKEPSREQSTPSSYQQPVSMFLGRFLKPYFKDKLTGLGPPANQETKEKSSMMTGCLNNKKLKMKRWEGWQKTLLIHSVARDSLRRLIQPKLSKVDFLSQKLSSAEEAERQQLREQIDSLEREIDLLRGKKEEELIGDRYEEHDWQKISNIDFEGTKDADDICCFWQNFLHPSINKSRWSQGEVEQLKEVSRRHGERHWETIAQKLGTGRTAFMCLQTFQRFVSDSLRRSIWTPDEDALLRELMDKMRIGNFIPYTQISYFMEGRDPAQLIYRWNQVLDPSLKKGPWTKEEDQLLLRAVSLYGEKGWWRVRLEVPGRTDGACRDRYVDCLRAGTKRGGFDKQEQELLLHLVEKHGVGRWAKIAAEIPHRYDAQCLREWRKMSRALAQKNERAKKPPKSREGGLNKNKKRIGRQVMNVKEESSEEDDMVVEYMDSDEEKKKKPKEEVKVEQTKEGEEQYTFPPMEEWVPTDKAQHFTFLSFRPVALPSSSSDAHHEHPVRSTILGEFGCSVIIGPCPQELQWEERHSSSTMMMVSPDQLRAHLHREARKFKNRNSRPKGRCQTGKQNHPGRAADLSLSYELQAAVTPWIGNLLIPEKSRLTVADALRERGKKTRLSSTPVFLLLLQAMNVDTMGCKEMIEQRRDRVLMPPEACPVWKTNPQTVAEILQQRKMRNLQDNLILKKLQVLQKQEAQQQLLLFRQQFVRTQQPQPLPSQSHPSMVPQMLPNMHPVSLPQAVFLPVVQPQQTASIQLVPPSSLRTFPLSPQKPPPTGDVTAQGPASPVSPANSTSFHQDALPLPQNLKVALPSPPSQAVFICSTLANRHTVPSTSSTPDTSSSRLCPSSSSASSTLDPHRGREQRDSREAVCSSQVDFGGADTGVEKANAVQEGGEAKSQTSNPQTIALLPPQLCMPSIQLLPQSSSLTTPPRASPASLRLNILPVPVGPVSTLDATPSSYDVSETQNLHPAPPPSLPGSRHNVSSTSNLSGAVPRERDYTFINFSPTPSQQSSNSSHPSPAPNQPSPSYCESDSNKPPPHQPRGRKRGRREEQTVVSSQDDQCGGGTGTSVVQKEKRVRKPSQRARALQETLQAKAEAKKKRATSSPCKKRSRTLCSKEEAVAQTQQVTQLQGMSLHSGQSIWVMTPDGLVQLAEASPKGLQLVLVPSAPLSPPPRNISNHPPATPPAHHTSITPKPPTVSVPKNLPNQKQPCLFPALSTCPSNSRPPKFVLHRVPNPSFPLLFSCLPQPTPNLVPHYEDTVKVDPDKPPPLRTEALQFDPSLMFLEPQEVVRDWLSGRGGVVVPGAGVALPYLPPFVSSLSTLSLLLQAKKSLTKLSLQLLRRGSRLQHPQTKAKTNSTEKASTHSPPDLPDSTSDLRLAKEQAPTVSSDQEKEEAELVTVVCQLVAERFSSNPAYQLLKARFLSCFTVPALLATVQPITEKTLPRSADHEEVVEEEEEEEEEEDEEEVELKNIIERGKRRRAMRSLLMSDRSGAQASHFSGITSSPPPTRRDQANGHHVTSGQ